MIDLADAIDKARRAGIVRRDLRPRCLPLNPNCRNGYAELVHSARPLKFGFAPVLFPSNSALCREGKSAHLYCTTTYELFLNPRRLGPAPFRVLCLTGFPDLQAIQEYICIDWRPDLRLIRNCVDSPIWAAITKLFRNLLAICYPYRIAEEKARNLFRPQAKHQETD